MKNNNKDNKAVESNKNKDFEKVYESMNQLTKLIKSNNEKSNTKTK